MADKRKSPPPASFASTSLVKRQRHDDAAPSNQVVIASSDDASNKGLVRTVNRTSNLSSPIVGLTGAHGVSILSYWLDLDAPLLFPDVLHSLFRPRSLIASSLPTARASPPARPTVQSVRPAQ